MKRQAIPMKVKNLHKMYQRNNLTFENEIQRVFEQWKDDQKSLLIHSILDDYIIPPIYLIKEDKGSKDSRGRAISDYDVLDGKQRLTTVFDYIEDKFVLSDITPTIEIDEEEFELAGKKFSELDEELQQNITNYGFTIYNLEGNSDEEVEEFFLRINGGVSLSKNQITKGKVGIKTMRYLNKLLAEKFFAEVCNFSGAQSKTEVNLCVLLQSAMMFDVNAGRYEFSTFSENDVQKYGASLHDSINEETMQKLEAVIGYLNEAFDDCEKKEKFLKKTHIPMVVLTADYAMENEIEPDQFREWFDDFAYNYYNPECEYAEYCGAGSVKKPKVFGRIEVMKNHFSNYFNLSNEEETEQDIEEEEPNIEEEKADITQSIMDDVDDLPFM